MRFELLNNKEQFKELKKGDMIIVKWKEYYTRRTQGVKEIMFYKIAKIYENEIICQKKYNHYFIYDNYLKKESNALEVYKVLG